MKRCLLYFALALPMLGQSEGGYDILEGPASVLGMVFREYAQKLIYSVWRNPDGTKTLYLGGYSCGITKGDLAGFVDDNDCSPVPQSQYENWAIVQGTIDNFERAYAGEPRKIVYTSLPAAAATPTEPQLIVLESKSDARLLLVDLKTLATTKDVTLPNGARLFGVRPSATGPGREIWTAHAGIGNQITITNLTTGKVETAVPTRIDENATPVNIQFSNGGSTAYYVVSYLNADANGNLGAMLIFDADARRLKSTLPLQYRPESFLMAPDGLTAYVVGNGKIVYYDVLSGTADLVITFPGINLLSAPQAIHPDGNRLFTLQTLPYAIGVFDTAQRKTVSVFPIKFALGNPIRFKLAQNGLTLTVLSDKDEIQTLDTATGQVISSLKGNTGTLEIFTAPVLQ